MRRAEKCQMLGESVEVEAEEYVTSACVAVAVLERQL